MTHITIFNHCPSGLSKSSPKSENHPHTDTRWILDISHVFNLGPLILFKAKGTKRNTRTLSYLIP